jgi:hypothetical protein
MKRTRSSSLRHKSKKTPVRKSSEGATRQVRKSAATDQWVGADTIRSSLKSLSPWRPCNLGPSRFSGGDMLRVQSRQYQAHRPMAKGRSMGPDHVCTTTFYRARNLVDRFFNKIKQCRRVATRYDKLAANNLAFISITAADLLNSVCATHSHYVSFVISAQTLGTSQLGCRRSIQSRMRVRADLSSGTSSASSKRPRGNIQKPKMGRKPSNPPQIRSIAAARRIHADAGRLNHRTAAFSRGGSRPIS